MPDKSKDQRRVKTLDSIVRTLNTVSTVTNAPNPFVKSAAGSTPASVAGPKPVKSVK